MAFGPMGANDMFDEITLNSDQDKLKGGLAERAFADADPVLALIVEYRRIWDLGGMVFGKAESSGSSCVWNRTTIT
jgi:hypothetical protein